MRSVIASTYVPFIKGGGTMIVESLHSELARRSYQVDVVKIPLRSYWADLPQQTLALRCLDLTESAGNTIDLLITIRYPSYALRHPNKVAWFIHHHRGAYDLWGTEYQDVPATPEGVRFREMLIRSDTLYLNEAKRIFTNSKVVASRLKKYNNIEANGVLYPPLPDPKPFHAGEFGDYFIYASRLAPIKRQFMAVEAMQYVKSNFKLVLVGTADVPSYADELQQLVERCGVADRVRFTGWLSEDDKAALTVNAYAALYIPFDEDSYGYSSLEAFHSHKPVITLRDSGGTDEVIEDGMNGLILDSTPEALAEGMERLWADKAGVARMGANAHETLRVHQIDWEHVIQGLVG